MDGGCVRLGFGRQHIDVTDFASRRQVAVCIRRSDRAGNSTFAGIDLASPSVGAACTQRSPHWPCTQLPHRPRRVPVVLNPATDRPSGSIEAWRSTALRLESWPDNCVDFTRRIVRETLGGRQWRARCTGHSVQSNAGVQDRTRSMCGLRLRRIFGQRGRTGRYGPSRSHAEATCRAAETANDSGRTGAHGRMFRRKLTGH